jgi:DMSO/TMAO reductase YedYZ molybdopterin-dependent catalytic subunit
VTAPERPRDALIAVKMNDEPLPADHGFPARLIVPGLYGYVSATKWLTEIELTTWEAFNSYWVPRGWAKSAPVLTQSRIDLPRADRLYHVGDRVAVAGVAWAMDRGVSRVEVQVDDGPWAEAVLASPLGPQTWVQWRYDWTAVAGRRTFRVRATDGGGVVQEERATRPDPDGARGYHAIAVQVD